MKFMDFRMSPRSDLSLLRHKLSPDSPLLPPDFRCLDQVLEIRIRDPFDGEFYCGTDIPRGSIMQSNSGNALIMLHTLTKQQSITMMDMRRRRDRQLDWPHHQLKIQIDFVERNASVNNTQSSTTVNPMISPTIASVKRPHNFPSLTTIWKSLHMDILLRIVQGLKAKFSSLLYNILPSLGWQWMSLEENGFTEKDSHKQLPPLWLSLSMSFFVKTKKNTSENRLLHNLCRERRNFSLMITVSA